MKYQYVDALRGIAVLLVVLVHVGQPFQTETLYSAVSKYGQFGVQMFYVMSAFTLCKSFNKNTSLTLRIYTGFMIRRFFRIAPLYYLAILFYFAWSCASFALFKKTPFTRPDEYEMTSVLMNIVFLHGIYPPGNNTIVPGGWSIGCEFLFYSGFPVWFLLARKRPILLPLAIVASFVATFLLIAFLSTGGFSEHNHNNAFSYYFISTQMPSFLLGMACFFYIDNKYFRKFAIRLVPVATCLLILGRETRWGWTYTPLAAGVLSVASALALEKARIPTLLQKIGERSFSIYLVHFLVAWVIVIPTKIMLDSKYHNSITMLCLYAIVTTVSYKLSKITYNYIELPFINLGHGIANRTLRAPKSVQAVC